MYIYIYIYIYTCTKIFSRSENLSNVFNYIYKHFCCRSKERIKICFKIGRSTKIFVSFELFFLDMCYIHVYVSIKQQAGNIRIDNTYVRTK